MTKFTMRELRINNPLDYNEGFYRSECGVDFSLILFTILTPSTSVVGHWNVVNSEVPAWL